MNRILSAAIAGSLICTAPLALAADFTVSGQFSFHNDIVLIDFSLASASTNVKLFTDSWQGGLNFDPMATLWLNTGTGFSRLTEVDDDDTVGAGQGFFDTGFMPANLPAGQYRLSLMASINASNGPLLSQGFAYDSQAPILLTQWTQPSYDPNANDQKGGFWRLQLNSVDTVSVVPEPASWLLFAAGLAGFAARRWLQAA